MKLFRLLALLLALNVDIDEAGTWVNKTLVHNAVEEGAVCLDGTPPAYHLDKGSGSGLNSWLVYLEGGGWCSNLADCAGRTRTPLGSSNLMNDSYFNGILSNSADLNPDFYNWNRVLLRYCDGASFLGTVREPMNFTAPWLQVQVTSRGILIWKSLIKELLSKGMNNADKALLGGCSAGGLAAFTHCSDFQEMMPQTAHIKCLSDAGFFIDTPDISGNSSFQAYYKKVYNFHNASEQLPRSCTSQYDSECIFPSYILPYIQAPILIVNPLYDVWQIQNVLLPSASLKNTTWTKCRTYPSMSNCTTEQLDILQGFRLKFLKILNDGQHMDNVAMYLNSCFTHCQTLDKGWNHPTSQNKTVQQAVHSWYFEEQHIRVIDNPYPSNPTCFAWGGWK